VKRVPLGQVATISRSGVDPSKVDPATRYIGLEHIERGGRILGDETLGSAGIKSTKFRFTPEHLLYGKLRPNLGKIARPNESGVCSTDILPVLPGPELDRDFLFHYLNQPDIVAFAASRATGANLPRLSPKALEDFVIPLPPLDEQRRIATILDQADTLRAKRRKTLLLLRGLEQAIYDDMFNAEAPITRFDSVVDSMRNGISPSNGGPVRATVLTLSAVTSGQFDPVASKESTFRETPKKSARVSGEDFLICRGNGNRALVGVGVSPRTDRPDLVFPDTVIAAHVDQAKIDPVFLEVVWRQPRTRKQIEAVARTTNGTFKINQQTLASVEIPIPPLTAQKDFVTRLESIPKPGMDKLDELFTSLQSRAFSGQL